MAHGGNGSLGAGSAAPRAETKPEQNSTGI
jgi:hypothetical protein